MIDKTPPHSPEDEQAVLGAMLIEKNAVEFAIEYLSPSDFYYDQNNLIFKTILEMSGRNAEVDVFSVNSELNRLNKSIGGVKYLMDATNSIGTAAMIKHHAEVVRDYSILRQVMRHCTEAITDCWEHEKKPNEILEKIERDVCSISNIGIRQLMKVGEGVGSMLETLENVYLKKVTVSGIETGFRKWDALSSGLQPGNLVVIAARPGMGKTSLALNIAMHNAVKKNVPAIFFSLEMSQQEIMTRVISGKSGISVFRLRTGTYGAEDWGKINRAAEHLYKAPLYLDCSSLATSVLTIRSACRRLAGKLGRDGTPLGLIVLDYLQLVSTTTKKADTRQAEVAEISRSLKSLALELNVPIIALSQLNRSPEDVGRNGRPRLSDLRESGAIEQDADMVAFIYREAMYKTGASAEEKNATKLIIAKQRNGSMGEIDMVFVPELTMFRELEPEPKRGGADRGSPQ